MSSNTTIPTAHVGWASYVPFLREHWKQIALVSAVSIASIIGFKVFQDWQTDDKQIRIGKLPPITISKLIIYPIKACKGISVSNILINPKGIKYDREYCIAVYNKTKNEYKMIAQNFNPKICLIECSIPSYNNNLKHTTIKLNAPNMNELEFKIIDNTDESILYIDYEYSNRKLNQRVSTKVKCYDQGENVSNWLTKYLNMNSKQSNNIFKLVKKCNINDRCISETSKPGIPQMEQTEQTEQTEDKYYINLQNSHPIMIASQESMNL